MIRSRLALSSSSDVVPSLADLPLVSASLPTLLLVLSRKSDSSFDCFLFGVAKRL